MARTAQQEGLRWDSKQSTAPHCGRERLGTALTPTLRALRAQVKPGFKKLVGWQREVPAWHARLTAKFDNDTHLVGPTISCEGMHRGGDPAGEWRANPHVQSHAVAVDQVRPDQAPVLSLHGCSVVGLCRSAALGSAFFGQWLRQHIGSSRAARACAHKPRTLPHGCLVQHAAHISTEGGGTCRKMAVGDEASNPGTTSSLPVVL